MTELSISLDEIKNIRFKTIVPVKLHESHAQYYADCPQVPMPRSVSTTPSPPSWRREGRSRESSWRRRGGTQSEIGDSSLGPHPLTHPLSAGTSRDSSTIRGHGSYRWSTYEPASASAAVSPALMTSSYHSCQGQDGSLAGNKEEGGNVSTVKSTNSYLSYRQPYLGWRSLERLKLSGQSCLTPEQRLAASLLNQVGDDRDYII